MVKGLHLPPRHRKEIVALLHKHFPGVEVWAYGSRVNGQSHDGSDLDLVLRGSQFAEIDTFAARGFHRSAAEFYYPFPGGSARLGARWRAFTARSSASMW